jgi:hypothetical protein
MLSCQVRRILAVFEDSWGRFERPEPKPSRHRTKQALMQSISYTSLQYLLALLSSTLHGVYEVTLSEFIIQLMDLSSCVDSLSLLPSGHSCVRFATMIYCYTPSVLLFEWFVKQLHMWP